jgi:hypothetical protein
MQQVAQRVTYVRKGQIVILKNSSAAKLQVGRTTFREPRLVVSGDIFQKMKKQNSDVRFVKGA